MPALTAQAPPDATYDLLVDTSQAVLLIAGVGGAVLCGWVGWVRGRRGGEVWRAVAGVAALWGLLVAAAGPFAILGPGLARPAGQANSHGHGTILALCAVVTIGVAAVPAGFAIGMVCASLAGRRDPPPAA